MLSKMKYSIGSMLFILFASTTMSFAGLPDSSLRDDIFYFVLTDRFYNGDESNDLGNYVAGVNPTDESPVDPALVHGYKPDNIGYYHGGDLVGLTGKLDYISNLGANAIWLTPVFGNEPVSGNGTIDGSSSSYHGYWIKDFYSIDPHLGSENEFRNFVSQAHQSGMKVVQDIVVNHTSDTIYYEECDDCPYISKQESPYKSIYGIEFDDVFFMNSPSFPIMDKQSFPYTPVIDSDKVNHKSPDWLNDPLYYSNRGQSEFNDENAIYGDFIGLDDLLTTHPKVVSGMTEIYQYWLREYNIDGFRLDTVKNVHDEFWQEWTPAILEHAQEHGRNDFTIFGEVFAASAEKISRYVKDEVGLPATLDYVYQNSVAEVFTKGQSVDRLWTLFENDDFYIDHDSNAYFLPTFISNHDIGRMGAMVRMQMPGVSEEELLKRSILAHAMMLTTRGIPVLYYGDEQGFTGLEATDNGDGTYSYVINDKMARQDMFPSQSPIYQDADINYQIGADVTPAADNFDETHPLFKAISLFSNLRKTFPEFRQGRQLNRYRSFDKDGGVFAFSRVYSPENREMLVVFNTHATESRQASIETMHPLTAFSTIFGQAGCDGNSVGSDENGVVDVELQPLSMIILSAQSAIPAATSPLDVQFVAPAGRFVSDSFWVGVEVPSDHLATVSFYAESEEGGFKFLGTDDNPPYRIYYDASELAPGSELNFRAMVSNQNQEEVIVSLDDVLVTEKPSVTVYYENGNNRTSVYGIFNSGQPLFPREFSGELTFDWPTNEKAVTLFFEDPDPNSALIAFDKPIYLSLLSDIYPNAELRNQTQLHADIYIDNEHGIQGVPLLESSIDLPEILQASPDLEERFGMPIYVRGAFNQWTTDNEMMYQGSATYFDQLVIDEAKVEYKFADKNWFFFNMGGPFTERGVKIAANPPNFQMAIPEGSRGLYDVHYFSWPQGAANDYRFYRFEFNQGSLGTNFELVNLLSNESAMNFMHIGNDVFRARLALSAGSHTFAIRDSLGSYSLGAMINDTIVDQGELDLINGSELTVTVINDVTLEFLLRHSDGMFNLTAAPFVDLGAFTEIYLRGGEAISGVSDWGADESNKFQYNPGNHTLELTKTFTTADSDPANWAFKLAGSDWAAQVGGAGEWLSAEAEVLAMTPYTVVSRETASEAEPAPLWIAPVVDREVTISFVVSFEDQMPEVLEVTVTTD